MSRLLRNGVVAVVLAMVLAGAACGDDELKLTEPAAAELDAVVEQIRSAASAGDRAGAELALASLRQRLEALHADGQISDIAAARIAERAEEVLGQLAVIPTTTTTTTTTTAPPRDDDEGDDD